MPDHRQQERERTRPSNAGYGGWGQFDQEDDRGNDQGRLDWQRGGRESFDQESANRGENERRYSRQAGMGSGSYYGEQPEFGGGRPQREQHDDGGAFQWGQRQGSSGAYGPRGQQSGMYGDRDRGYGQGSPQRGGDSDRGRGGVYPQGGEQMRGGYGGGYTNDERTGWQGDQATQRRDSGSYGWDGGQRGETTSVRPFQGSGWGMMGSDGPERARGFGEMAEGGSGRWTDGPYAGRGPRGYHRSDEKICDDVCERLTHFGEIDATGIEVSVERGEVTLSGSVRDRWQKRMSAEIAEDVSGVRDVNNRLKIEGNSRDDTPQKDQRKTAADAFNTNGSSEQESRTTTETGTLAGH